MQGVLRLQGPLWKFLSMYPNKNLPAFVLCFSTPMPSTLRIPWIHRGWTPAYTYMNFYI